MKNIENNLLNVGTLIKGKWVILEFIAKDGMNEIYRAHQLNLKRDVAVKVISQEWLESFDGDTGENINTLGRFHAEVQAMAQVRHTSVLQFYDFGSEEIKKGNETITIEYLVMEYIPGKTLRSTMTEEGFHSDEDAVKAWISDYFIPVLDGVEAMHNCDIFHRDLKPENILMDKYTPKITNFDLACSSPMDPMSRPIDVKGSPAYMSPEQFFDLRRADQQADVYSLGKILFEAVMGKITTERLPFKQVSLPDPATPFMREMDRIIRAATVEDKEDRLSSVANLRDMLIKATFMVEHMPPQKITRPAGRASSRVPFGPRLWACLAIAIVAVVSIGASNNKPATGFNNVSAAVLKPPQAESFCPIPKQRSLQSSPNTKTPGWYGDPDCDTEPGYRRW